ncbi:hypothetical protein D3C84_635770 [compost metagenome]
MVGQELRQVARADQAVDRPRLAGQALQVLRGGGGDDAVVGADLGVVPGPRAALRVEVGLQGGQRRIGLGQCGEDPWCLAVLAQRQVAAVAARIGDDLVGLVERLGDVEGFLGAEAELLRADLLQGAEIERQRRRLAHALGRQLDQPGAGRAAHGFGGVTGQLRFEAAALLVAGVFRGAPLGGEGRAVGQQLYVDGPERYRHEVGDAAVAVHHQAQGRCLHPAHRQHALVAGLAAEQGEQPAHVHADQPVGARAAERGVVEAEGLRARLERLERLADRRIVQRRQPQPLDRPAIAAVLHQLAGDHLALAVGVGGDHQLVGFAEQTLDRLELAGGLRFDQHLPLLGDDRQVGQAPALVAGVVGIRRRGFQQVTDAPGHRHVGAQPAAVAAPAGAEHLGDVLGLGGFFAEVEPHGCRDPGGSMAHRM